MKDLFDKEAQALRRAEQFLSTLDDGECAQFKREFASLTCEYAQMLRQLRWVTRISDRTALGLNTDKCALLNKVNMDSLTEIYNRRFLMANLEHYLEALGHEGGWISVLMLDVDYFKAYNDTYGHLTGDLCLRRVANALRTSLSGAEDFVVRYGGEEFIAVLPGADAETGMRVARRILQSIWNLNIPHESSEIADRVTLSIGLVSTVPIVEAKMQQYIDRADAALYLSKKNGRNRITHLSIEEDEQ